MKLFEVTRWGNDADGANGADTNYLVCAPDHVAAAALVLMRERRVDAITDLATLSVEIDEPVIFRGPYVQHKLALGTHFTQWLRESPAGHGGVEIWVPHPSCRDGEATCHYVSGPLAARSNWRAGQPTGACTTWYPNGQLMHHGEYAGGRRTGVHDWWYEDGTPASHYAYGDGGVTFRTWDSDGNIVSEGTEIWTPQTS